MDEHTLYAARDRHGVRPLSLGRLVNGWVVASATAALDIVGAKVVRDVEPGELTAIAEDGPRSHRFAQPARARCAVESVHRAPPARPRAGKHGHAARTQMGRQLAAEYPVDADLVSATPGAGTPAAVGYAEASGIPFGQGLMKNAY